MKNKNRRLCRRCKYSRKFTYNDTYNTCHYILIEHRMRGCPVEECDKFKPRERGEKK